ncbi:hypothetical protein [Amphibacillus jilinensis]|uniref:hypothetical protein n=1 Tax=Amphibacillus jilinensis TaxID=1216008 RepID=UPI0002FF9F7A|nr:hypothetical protein [Amphibacillus jilinensis]
MKFTIKESLLSFIYLIGLLLLLWLIVNNNIHSVQTGDVEWGSWVFRVNALYAGLGVYLALPIMLKRFKVHHKWVFNLNKFIFVSLPLFIFPYLPIIFTTIELPRFIWGTWEISLLIASYTLITSFEKENKFFS